MIKKTSPVKSKIFFFIFIFFFFIGRNLCGQAYLEIGYKVGLWLNPSAINGLIKDFNAKYPSEKFKTIHGAHGARIVFGAQTSEGIVYYAGLDWLRSIHTASGIDSASGRMDYRQVTVHNGGITMGIVIPASDNFGFGFEINAFNYFVVRAQQAYQPNFKLGYDYHEYEVVNRVNPEINFFVRMSGWLGIAGLSLTPKIDFPVILSKNDLSELAREWLITPTSSHIYMRGASANITLALLLGKRRD